MLATDTCADIASQDGHAYSKGWEDNDNGAAARDKEVVQEGLSSGTITHIKRECYYYVQHLS